MEGGDIKQQEDIYAQAKRQRDFDDLQDEHADRDTGRTKRFGVTKAEDTQIKRDKEAAFRNQLTALDQLLEDDPIYAALHVETMDILSRAESTADEALEQAKSDLHAAETSLHDIQDSANQLPDGTRIYKDADGTVWTEDGRLVSKEDMESVVWKDRAPTREDYLSGKQTVDAAKQRIVDIDIYIHSVLGPARDRLTDPDNPPFPDEIEGIQGDIKDGAESLQLSHSADETAPDTQANLSKIKLPDLAG